MELKFSPPVFSRGAGIFFIGYFLFEMPRNVARKKFGASRIQFWLPPILKAFGFSNAQTGFVTAVPYRFGAVAMVFWPGIPMPALEPGLRCSSSME